jgi:hypothetical protein
MSLISIFSFNCYWGYSLADTYLCPMDTTIKNVFNSLIIVQSYGFLMLLGFLLISYINLIIKKQVANFVNLK